jgi:hypothetical protein
MLDMRLEGKGGLITGPGISRSTVSVIQTLTFSVQKTK